MSQLSSERPSQARLVLAFATIYLVWGSTYLAIRLAVAELPPFGLAAARFLLAGSILLAWWRWRGGVWPTWGQVREHTVVGTFLLLGGNGSVTWAEQELSSGLTALLIGVGPLMIVLTEWAWPGGRRPGYGVWAPLLLGLGGLAWLAAPTLTEGPESLPWWPVVVVLLGCVSWAVGSIAARHGHSGAAPLLAAALQMLGGGTALVLVALLHGDFVGWSPSQVGVQAWGAFAYLVVVGSLVGFSTFVWLLQHCAPARVATYAYVNPVVAVALGWWWLAEPVTVRTLVSAGVIVTAVAWLTAVRGTEASGPPKEKT